VSKLADDARAGLAPMRRSVHGEFSGASVERAIPARPPRRRFATLAQAIRRNKKPTRSQQKYEQNSVGTFARTIIRLERTRRDIMLP